jgi:hypothetical protein
MGAADPAIEALCNHAAGVAYWITQRIEGARQSTHGEEGRQDLRDASHRRRNAPGEDRHWPGTLAWASAAYGRGKQR